MTLQTASPNEQILGKVLNYLSYRPRSWSEIVRRLKTYTTDPEAHAFVIDFLKKHSLVDDEKFANWWITSRSAKHSHKMLEAELKQKGISQEIIEQQLARSGDELASLRSLLEKKLKSDPSLIKDNLPKLYRYLLGKGYTYANIQQVIN